MHTQVVEVTMRLPEGASERLVEDIAAYSAFVAHMAEIDGPQSRFLPRLT